MKIALAIQSCAAYRDRRDGMRTTWLRDKPDHVDACFFVGGGTDCDDATCLPCGDAYADCAAKQFEMIRHCRDYDYVFFCDDDTYVVVGRLMESGFQQHQYMGCPCRVDEGNFVMAHGGAGFWMSRAAMAAALEIGPGHPRVVPTTFSDRLVGNLMTVAGVPLWGDYRFNLGKYVGDRGFCNIVPTLSNRYVTTHFVSPALAAQIYDHFTAGTPLQQMSYYMTIAGRRVLFSEDGGRWSYHVAGGTSRSDFALAHEAEVEAFLDLGAA